MKTPTALTPEPALPPTFPVPAAWQWHLETLLRLRQRLQNQSKEHLSAAEVPREPDNDFTALASDESDFTGLIREVQSEEHLLAEVGAALERLRLGTYGRCESTHQPISAARLSAVPWTRYCREAADHLEH